MSKMKWYERTLQALPDAQRSEISERMKQEWSDRFVGKRWIDSIPSRYREWTRSTLLRVLAEHSIERIMTGDDVKHLKDGIELYGTQQGYEVAAATFRGIGYKTENDLNEDRIVIVSNPDVLSISVIDGMGGPGDGALAAQWLAEGCLHYPNNTKMAVHEARKAMLNYTTEKIGATFLTIRPGEDGFELIIPPYEYAGDVKLMAINDAKKRCVYESKDHTELQKSLDRGMKKENSYMGFLRVAITNYIGTPTYRNKPEFVKPVELAETVDTLIIADDGVTDNITPEEIAEHTAGQRPEQVIATISDILDGRMKRFDALMKEGLGKRLKSNTYSDGFFLEPKRDNTSIVVIKKRTKSPSPH